MTHPPASRSRARASPYVPEVVILRGEPHCSPPAALHRAPRRAARRRSTQHEPPPRLHLHVFFPFPPGSGAAAVATVSSGAPSPPSRDQDRTIGNGQRRSRVKAVFDRAAMEVMEYPPPPPPPPTSLVVVVSARTLPHSSSASAPLRLPHI
ncbi:hypothetical protein GUJ93_ZPchr0002g24352 [Zizania palustris]|uniref:Uncharacterized protein n=1 Tax=Zizania palustris TaxID=103762 RepID=A0A8J5S3Q5_ZIZPA|nr:hypothetical protein GUJ93_ZPchr0002g24352 [Zizania palustris]